MKKTDGFTLIELLVTLVVAAIIIVVGIPGLGSLMANSQATTHANDLMTALTFARSESVKRGSRVSICAKSTAAPDNFACADGGGDWANGWIVFHDPDGGGTPDSGEEQLRSWSAPSGSYTAGGPSAITFNSAGAIQSDAVELTIRYTHCTGTQNRTITVQPTGHTSVSKDPCT